MSSDEGLERLLFDLASESRLSILKELSQNKLKMAEVARKLDLTATENFRQLQRLSEAKLVQKLSDGEYTLTAYGKLNAASAASPRIHPQKQGLPTNPQYLAATLPVC